METAVQQLLTSIEELLAGQDDALMVPMTTISQTVKEVVEKNAKIVTRMQEKIVKSLNRQMTMTADGIDKAQTRVLAGLDAWQADIHYMLTQLASKSNSIKTGETLEKMIVAEAEKAPELAYAGTLVLGIAEAKPWLERITLALESIAATLKSEQPQLDQEEEKVQEEKKPEPTDEPAEDAEIDLPHFPSKWF